VTTTDQRQDAELDDHQHRLERLEQAFPTPDTPQGGAQRARIHIPTPDSLLTVGARGSNATRGRAEGPGGVSLYTVENFATEIHGATILDTDGNTIIHSGERVCLVAEAESAFSTNANLRIGTLDDIEITAGGAGFTDPAFTVRPSMDVPDPPEVDTASPRSGTETMKSAWSGVWRAWSINAALSSWASFLNSSTEGVQGAALERSAATALGVVRASVTLGEALWDTLMGLGAAFDDPHSAETSEPKIKMHAAGGISMTSPAKISAFSEDSVSIGAPYSCSLKGGWKASLSSGGNAKVFGIASATVASKGVVGVKGKVVGTKGDFIESKAKRAASLTTDGKLLLQAKDEAVLDGDKVAVAGNEVAVGAAQRVDISAKSGQVDVKGERRVRVQSPGDVLVEGDQSVQLRQGRATVAVDNDQVEMRAGSTSVIVSSGTVSVHGLTVRQGEVRIRGRCNFG